MLKETGLATRTKKMFRIVHGNGGGAGIAGPENTRPENADCRTNDVNFEGPKMRYWKTRD